MSVLHVSIFPTPIFVFSHRSSLTVFRYVLSAVKREKIPSMLLEIPGEKRIMIEAVTLT